MKYLIIILAMLFISCGNTALDEEKTIESKQIVLNGECDLNRVWKDYIQLKELGLCINNYKNEQDFTDCRNDAIKVKSYVFICVEEDVIYL